MIMGLSYFLENTIAGVIPAVVMLMGIVLILIFIKD